MADLLTKMKVKHVVSHNETKVSLVERMIYTVFKFFYRYMTAKNTHKWYDVLESVIHSYNHTIHSAIRVIPADVDENTRYNVWATQFITPVLEKIEKRTLVPGSTKHQVKKARYKYKQGDHVRVSHLRKAFHRAYSQQFSGEIFKIVSRWRRDNLPVYKIADWDDTPIQGTFHQQELQRVTVNPEDTFQIDKVLKRRKRGNKREALASWVYYPKKFNSWIPEKDMVNYAQNE